MILDRYVVIDPDERRRAALTHQIRQFDDHAQPYADINELEYHWPSEGTIIVHDSDPMIGSLADLMVARGQWLPLIAYSEAPSVDRVVKAIRCGALDYAAWPIEYPKLKFRFLETKEQWIGLLEAKQRYAQARMCLHDLSKREMDVLNGIANGGSNKSIARNLGISPRTVEIHRANMMGKLPAETSAAAIRIALESKMTN